MNADDTTERVDVEIDKAVTESDTSLQRKPAAGRSAAVHIKLTPAILVLLLLVSSGLAAWLYFSQYRPDTQTGDAAAKAATTAAAEGMAALLSYRSKTLDQDLTAAKSHLSGDFLNDYEARVREVVIPAVKGKDVTTTAQVVGAAVSELRPDSAVVLVFIDQTTVSKDRPDPAMWASSVLVSLTKADGKWLITKFEPV
ncbi:hypothetical protein A5707_20290 [Mycobacterium kyorinense]|uniref:Twin-arginine translocation pathway signal n=1 Tax=Mycobacterium kyorinense TaxID=487514 RepID=A0A1A2ZDN7_9MYCO|nr:hypothetical protein [Mycobacterium kyorinense]OBI47216.1 hypothetical protein A5707_20290 [Mycobacterium kyorinense]